MNMDPGNSQVQELVNLVEALYNERDPAKISSIQSYLQNVQKSDDGIKFADLLLSTSEYSLNCKFFGALTYIVNLNLYKADHSKLDIDSILNKLLYHLTTCLNDYRVNKVNNILIVKKLFQSLSIIFNSYPINHQQWKCPISSLIQILLTNKNPENVTEHLEIDQYIPNIISDNTSTQLLLTFSSIITEDLTRIGNDKVDVALHESVQLYLYKSTKSLILASFESNNDVLIKSSIETLNVWIQYISYAQRATTLRYNEINDLLQYLVLFLTKYSIESDIFQLIVNLIIEIFENNPSLFSIELRNEFNELFSSDWSTMKVNEYFQSQNIDDLETFVNLILSFFDIDIIKFASTIFKPDNSKLLTFLLNLTNLPLKPVLEETISKKFIEFWCKIAEILIYENDNLAVSLKEDPELIQIVKNNSKTALGEISKIYFSKISLSITLDSEFKQNSSEFFSYKDDLTELFDVIYSNIGFPLFENLIDNVMNNQDINQIETSLFLLGTLSYNFSSNTVSDQVLNSLNTLFESEFLINYSNLINSNTNEFNRDYYAKTVIRFLGSIGYFYQKQMTGDKYLNFVIDYLFNCLKLYESQQSITSKIILEICDDCRTQLVDSISKFESILVETIQNNSIPAYTREKLINSISCIIQSIPNTSIQLNHIAQIITLIENASQPYLIQASNNALNEKDFQYLFSLFSSIFELAKGLQVPEDFEETEPESFKNLKSYYLNNPSSALEIQQNIIKLIDVFVIEIELLSSNSLINEVATQIYKIGLLEDFGPFSFSSSSVLEYTLKKLPKSTSTTYAYLLELLITLFNVGLRLKSSPHQQISDTEVSNILKTFIIDKWTVISEDPDLVQLSMTLFSSLVQNKPNFFINDTDSFQFIVKTSISLLYSKEKFIIKSVSKFWTGLLSAKKITETESQVLKSFIENDVGAFLTYSVFNALIDCSRSDTEAYGNIVVLLLVRHSLKFKDWLKESLDKINSERLNSGSKELADREIFMKKLLTTRGFVRKGNDLVKEFWISTNGLISYTSK